MKKERNTAVAAQREKLFSYCSPLISLLNKLLLLILRDLWEEEDDDEEEEEEEDDDDDEEEGEEKEDSDEQTIAKRLAVKARVQESFSDIRDRVSKFCDDQGFSPKRDPVLLNASIWHSEKFHFDYCGNPKGWLFSKHVLLWFSPFSVFPVVTQYCELVNMGLICFNY